MQEKHDEMTVFFRPEPVDGEFDATFAMLDHAGAGTAELTERQGGLDASVVDRGLLHSVSESTRGGSDRLKITLSSLPEDEQEQIVEAMRYSNPSPCGQSFFG